MRLAALTTCLFALSSAASAAESTVVHKVADPLEVTVWTVGPWNTATATVSMVADTPAELAGTSTKALAVEVAFAGKGFTHAAAEPAHPLVIPGAMKRIDLWYKGDGQDYPLILNLVDAWGRSEVGGTKYEWNIGSTSNTAWKHATFDIPAAWMKPIRISGLSTHNWNAQNTAATLKVLIDQIEVDTDLAGADPTTGLPADFKPNPDEKKKNDPLPHAPLLEATLVSGQETETFTGLAPAFVFSARNWRAGALKGTLTWTLSDLPDGVTLHKLTDGTTPVTVDSLANQALPMPVPRFGLYRLDARLTWADKTFSDSSITFAAIPPQPVLDEAAKDASPWGINQHGGSPVFNASYRRAGVIWYRDYAFAFDWMTRAKGANKTYADWPYYPVMMASYAAAGVRVLPILMHSISLVEGKNGPDRAWRGEVTDIISAFPQLKVWELDNEYDGLWTQPALKDQAQGWANYKAYHKAFADVVAAVGGGELTAVENGQAGIHPERTAEIVKSGAFAGIQVANCHHYCGVDAPELNVANQNTGGTIGDGETQLFHDRLRAEVAAARSDGIKRPVWLTEFGWDTRAGKIVSPYQQAAYLPRGFLVAFHAGISKAFWYWWQDGEKFSTFFDGCGLLDFKRQPKLGFGALAGITSLMPSPHVGGTLDAGPGTFGFLVRQGDQRIAALWKLEAGTGPEVAVTSGQLYDFLGNQLTAKKIALGLTPVYIVGIGADEKFAKQGSWDLASPWLVQATAGDPLTVQVSVTGDRAAAITGTIALEAPTGWPSVAAKPLTVAPGAQQTGELTITIPATALPGEYVLTVPVVEGQPLKRMTVRVLVRAPLSLQAGHLTGEPGPATLDLTLVNHSQRELSGKVRLALPSSWSTDKTEIEISALKAGEQRVVSVPLTWSAEWKASERATAEAVASDGSSSKAGIIPGALAIHRLASYTPDGDLSEWPAATLVPDWVLACSEPATKTEVHLGWTPEGLAIGLKVSDSVLQVSDPQAFWAADAMEFLIDTRDRHAPRPVTKGERQFWLVAQPATKGIFAGQWKRGDEIPATRNGVPEIRGGSKVVGDGYVLEALIPTALIPGLELKSGSSAAALLLLTVHGKTFERQIGWPATKSAGTGGGPDTWPVLFLTE